VSGTSFLEKPRAALAALGLVLGCAGSRADFPTVTRFPDDPRRAPGVAVDPTPELPKQETRSSTERGLVSLRAPVDPSAARSVVREFFRLAVAEAASELDALFAQQAWVDSAGTRQPARQFWRSRLTQLDYKGLGGQLVYREAELESYRAEDQAALATTRRLPFQIQPDEVVVRVPIAVSWTGRARLFGDEVVFRLRPNAGRYEIHEIIEDFRLP
jgi:hypothetical protein